MNAARLAEVRRVLAFYLGTHSGRNPFEGHNTERVYTLVARGRIFWDIALDARVLALCERFLLPNFLLTASQAICIRPGERPQAFHHDDTFYTVPRPRPMISISTIAAVDEFTAENGGTEVIPGSHLWGDDWSARVNDPTRGAKPKTVVMPAGACVMFSGTLVHRAGANRSPAFRRLAFLESVLPAWARQQENVQLQGVGPSRWRARCRRVHSRMLGYSISIAVHGASLRRAIPQGPGPLSRTGRAQVARRRARLAGVIEVRTER
jgi:ectoine hydroxylase-related dioxygenase (phytanoyl-CoA dioxygenase family)